MRFLFPSGGLVDHRFGILASPQHKGVPIGIIAGMFWAADLGCLDGPKYVKRFKQDKALPWLATMKEFRASCIFVNVPDVVGNAQATLEAFEQWYNAFEDWPLAFAAQNGQEFIDFPLSSWTTLFVGGDTEWKTSDAAVGVIARARAMGKHIHIGRVNWWRRYKHFRGLEGSEEFTCDGTRQRFEGIDKTVAAWADYQQRDYQARLPLFDRYRFGESGSE